jgi:hypothetical protein
MWPYKTEKILKQEQLTVDEQALVEKVMLCPCHGYCTWLEVYNTLKKPKAPDDVIIAGCVNCVSILSEIHKKYNIYERAAKRKERAIAEHWGVRDE